MYPSYYAESPTQIDGLGPVEAQDITFDTTVTSEGYEHSMTVYFHRPGSDDRNRMRLVT